MAHLAGKSGNVYVATTIIDDCEDAWVSGTNGTASLETTKNLVKVGDGSSKCIVNAIASAGDIVMYESILAGATNYSTFTHVLCWARSTVTSAAADFRLALDNTAAAVSPETLLDFPALTQDTWKYCHLTEVAGSLMSSSTAATVVGLEMNADIGAVTIYLDDIRAAKNIAGINSWTLDYTSDALETTDFASAGVKDYIIGASGWSGSFAGYKDGTPLSIGTIWGVELAESATTTQMWLGNIIITGVHPSVASDGIVSYSYDFQGTGSLAIAST